MPSKSSTVMDQDLSDLPKFQQIQHMFCNHIRDPKNFDLNKQKVQGLDVNVIESRRMEAYESLFFNNVHDFFSTIFPVLKSLNSEERWEQITREYMHKHKSRTPLFHELGQEYIKFLKNEYEMTESDHDFMLELAHFEWAELAVSIETGEAPSNNADICVDLDDIYELSSVAWPLAYDWPVHKITVDNQPTEKPELATTILVYRDSNYIVQFLELSPLLYELLNRLDGNEESIKNVLTKLANDMEQNVEIVIDFTNEILRDLLVKNILSVKVIA